MNDLDLDIAALRFDLRLQNAFTWYRLTGTWP